MAIDRLSSTAALIAALRADQSRRTDPSRRRAKPQGSRTDAASAPAPRDVEALRAQLVDLVRGKDIGDADTVRRLRPAVVRSMLLWEFGAELREHPEWQPMFDGIVAALEADPRQVRGFAALLADLQGSARK